ncbi:beta-lactamase [Rhodotorula diobovata]|uniref:Beta-lactamase n=1 Tax=Rhodotorula diobovata TaxID=5288 RepID=A0A5C5FWL2_9BASI|nr:beta-lactamase [Rhodotorula diobovata]
MPPTNPSVNSDKLPRRSDPLEVHYKIHSEAGLSSISTLIVGSEACVLIDPPFLIPDAKELIAFIKDKTSLPLQAVFCTHHHPDHYFSANPILEAWPESSFYAAPYVLAGIEREYDEKIVYWPSLYGDLVPKQPRKPDPYPFSFFLLPGNTNSPVILLGPVIGDTVDHTMFWLPREKVIITGDCMYGRSTHVWAAEIETPDFLEAWRNVLRVIEGLEVETIIPGHLESASGLELDAEADMAHNRKYLDLFATKITYAERKHPIDDLYKGFRDAFPDCKANHDFFLGMLSKTYGEGGEPWKENAHHNISDRKTKDLEEFVVGNSARLAKAKGSQQ